MKIGLFAAAPAPVRVRVITPRRSGLSPTPALWSVASLIAGASRPKVTGVSSSVQWESVLLKTGGSLDTGVTVILTV